jgi:hypothetical protein
MAKNKPLEDRGLPSVALALGYIAVKEEQRLEDKIDILTRLGYGAEEIAIICKTTKRTVYTLRHEARKPRKTKKTEGTKNGK